MSLHIQVELVFGCECFVTLNVVYELLDAELADLRIVDAVARWLPLEVKKFVLVYFLP